MNREIRIAIVIYVFVTLFGCGGGPANHFSEAETLNRGLAGEPSSLDPGAAADNFSFQVLQDLYEGLTAESPEGNVLPAAAASWTVNAAGTEYTFHIRSDARWSNGKPVRAGEFVHAWQRVVDPKSGSSVSDDLRLIKNAAAIIAGTLPPSYLGAHAFSDETLIVNLERPAPYLPQLFTHSSTFPTYSETSARSHAAGEWVSNGPYVLSKWLPGTRIELTKNAQYWDQVSVHVPHINYQIAPDQNVQLAQYRAGQLDMTDIVPPSAIPWIRSEHAQELVVAPFLATAYFGLNLSEAPFSSNLPLRKALAMAIDRRRIAAAQGFGQPPAYGFVPPGTWNYKPQTWDWAGISDSTRIAQAKLLFAQAGFSSAHPLHLRLLINSNTVIKQTAILVASMWKETLDIETEISEEEYRVFLQSRHEKARWDVVRLGWIADFNDATNFLDTFRRSSPNNDTGYDNRAFDALLDKAAATASPQDRRELLEKAEVVMLSDYPIVPLYFFVSKRLVKPYVRGVEPNPLDRLTSKSLSLTTH
jgi:oligopeptide transport system substrate-binding protein